MSITLILAAVVAWSGLSPENHLGGRKVSEGYLQGKVVFVQRWRGDDPASLNALSRMERVWTSYKTKPFVLLGSHVAGAGAVAMAEKALSGAALTYPVYGAAELKDGAPLSEKIPYYYVVDAVGRVVFRGADERLAEMALVNALTNLASPPNVAYWKRLIDYERDVLPGRAYVHLQEFRKAFPAEAKAYEEDYRRLRADETVQKLARLEVFSRHAKDFDPRSKPFELRKMLSKIGRTLSAYSDLKKVPDAIKAQEAKNCLADLLWARAALNARIEK
jgi:hypothetical protein